MKPEVQLTNNEATETILQKFELHAIDDATHFKSIEEKMSTLATKADIKEMKEAFDDFIYAMKLFRSGSKWGYRAFLVVASIVVATVAIGGGYKTIISWFR